jgi:APA family basic amino acid/polyamine antiporter
VSLLIVILLGIFFFDLSIFPKFNLTNESNISIIPIVASLTLYAFLGIESASIPAEHVKNPKKNISKATMIGTLICVLVYILGTSVLFGLLPAEIMQNSPAPFVDAAEKIGGKYIASFVGLGTIIAGMGALNGWILMTGQMPLAASKDKLFPEVFGRLNKKGVPLLGLIIGSILTSLVMLMNYNDSLVDQFEFIILLSTFTCLVPYLFTAVSFSLISFRNSQKSNVFKNVILSGAGFLFSIWAIYGSGQESVFFGFILLLLGIPLYVYIKWNIKT